MNEATEATEAAAPQDAVTAAQAGVTAAEAALAEAEAAVISKDDMKALTDAAKAAKANHKQAIAYRKGLADGDENIASADEAVTGWAAEETRTSEAVDKAKAGKAAAAETVKARKADLREAKKTLTAAKKGPKTKVERVEQNGKKHPLPNTKCGDAWQVYDDISAAAGRPAKSGEAIPLAIHRGLNEGNVKAEYGNWRKFHGVENAGRATTADLAALAPHFPEVVAYTNAVEKAKADAAEAERKAQEKAAKEQAAKDKAAAEAAAAAAAAEPAPAEPAE